LKLRGRGTGELRLPMCGPDSATEGRFRRTLVGYGLLPARGRGDA
jgi:4-hydroxy-tetrahydrodipicolinate synthase